MFGWDMKPYYTHTGRRPQVSRLSIIFDCLGRLICLVTLLFLEWYIKLYLSIQLH